MNTFDQQQKEDVWAKIEAEKRRDRLVRRISVIAWGITLVALIIFTAMVGGQVWRVIELYQVGVANSKAMYDAVMPLVAVLGSVSLLIAILSTVGVFLRIRTASLGEIQLRLAALEELILSQPGEEGE